MGDHEYMSFFKLNCPKSYWEPKVAEAYTALEAIADLDPESDEYVVGISEAQQISTVLLRR